MPSAITSITSELPAEVCLPHDGKGAACFRVKAFPKSRRSGVEGVVQIAGARWALRVLTTAAPEKGKANQAVRALLAEFLNVAPSRLELVSGETAQLKVFRVTL